MATPEPCRCKDPWKNHPQGFKWGTPPDGSVHIPEKLAATLVIG